MSSTTAATKKAIQAEKKVILAEVTKKMDKLSSLLDRKLADMVQKIEEKLEVKLERTPTNSGVTAEQVREIIEEARASSSGSNSGVTADQVHQMLQESRNSVSSTPQSAVYAKEKGLYSTVQELQKDQKQLETLLDP